MNEKRKRRLLAYATFASYIIFAAGINELFYGTWSGFTVCITFMLFLFWLMGKIVQLPPEQTPRCQRWK